MTVMKTAESFQATYVNIYIDLPPFHDFSTLYLHVSHTARLSPSKTFTPTTFKHFGKLTFTFFSSLIRKNKPTQPAKIDLS